MAIFQSLLQEGRRTHAELEDAKRDKDALEMEVTQMNQKLSSVREKLDVAVIEGKLIEKQRDFLKQVLEEKITELESSNVGHIQVLQVKDAELSDIKLKLEQSEEQRDLFVSALQEVLVESSLPADLNLMEPLDVIDWLVREYVHGKGTISLWMKRAEDSEKRAVADRVKYESDLEDTIKEAMSHSSNFSIRLEELEGIIQQKDNSLRTMELAQGQVVTKCSDLVEQLRESRRQCDVLAAELDKLPETLRNKENDIIRLQDEAALMAGSSAAHVQSFREVSLDVGEESDDFFIDPSEKIYHSAFDIYDLHACCSDVPDSTYFYISVIVWEHIAFSAVDQRTYAIQL